METKSLKIEIYGIPEAVSRCAGCMHATKILNDLGLPYEFYDVLYIDPVENQVAYNRGLIESLAERAGFPSLNIRYPVIFINDKLQHNLRYFKQFLLDQGFDPDLIED